MLRRFGMDDGVVGVRLAVPLWRITDHAITIAHEGGHALFGSCSAATIKNKIHLNRDGGGSPHRSAAA
jgi:hypothetical protein